MEFYRAVPKEGFQDNQQKKRYATPRLLGNIPYLIDNLWELARPDWAPSRRYAVYASPTKELALHNACAGSLKRDQYVVCRLTFKDAPTMIQLSVPDAREHDDVGRLQKFVNSKLVTWAGTSVADKLEMATLFLPGITKDELMAAMNHNTFFKELASEAKEKVTLWSEYPAKAAPDGEFFFEMALDNAYWLHKV